MIDLTAIGDLCDVCARHPQGSAQREAAWLKYMVYLERCDAAYAAQHGLRLEDINARALIRSMKK